MLKKHQDNDGNHTAEVIQDRERKQIEANAEKVEQFLSENEPRTGHRGKEMKSTTTVPK